MKWNNFSNLAHKSGNIPVSKHKLKILDKLEKKIIEKF